MSNKDRLLYGVGINDADYVTQINEPLGFIDGKYRYKRIWSCPYFYRWRGIITRCYSQTKSNLAHNKAWIGCSVDEKWHRFSNFRAWMIEQDWEGKDLDKDILFPGNKVYGPDTCVFVDPQINNFIIECTSAKGDWPVGVYWNTSNETFHAMCRNPFSKKQEHIGCFQCPDEAHKSWLKRKLELAYELAKTIPDVRVGNALVNRYENYGNW